MNTKLMKGNKMKRLWDTMEENFNYYRNLQTDINEHFDTIKEYAEKCEHITEIGVRGVNSTWAFLSGKPAKMVSIDKSSPMEFGVDINKVKKIANENNIDWSFILSDVLQIELEETDLLFIDTLHTYPQLSKELKLHGNKARKYIIMHDTETNKYIGDFGEEGLQKAIEEFLLENKHWSFCEIFTNNNGLTILKRVGE